MLEPEIAAFIERATAIYPAHTTALTPPEQRTMYDRYAALLTPPLPDEITTQDAEFRESTRVIRSHCGFTGVARRLTAIVRGTVLYFHGGGFVLGSLNSHQMVTARIAADTGLDVVAVDYRLAPEHRAPAAHDDCMEVTLAALEWTLAVRSPRRRHAATGRRQCRRQSRGQHRDAAA